jgi:uncharacterized protein HemY
MQVFILVFTVAVSLLVGGTMGEIQGYVLAQKNNETENIVVIEDQVYFNIDKTFERIEAENQ